MESDSNMPPLLEFVLHNGENQYDKAPCGESILSDLFVW